MDFETAMLNKRQGRVRIFFYINLYKYLRNTNPCIMTENRLINAHAAIAEISRKQGLEEDIREPLWVMDVFIILVVVMISKVYNPSVKAYTLNS